MAPPLDAIIKFFEVGIKTCETWQATRCCSEYSDNRFLLLQFAGNTFYEAVEAETSGNLQTAYKAIIAITRDHQAYYAQKIYDSMRGIGTDDDALIRHIVGRSEVS